MQHTAAAHYLFAGFLIVGMLAGAGPSARAANPGPAGPVWHDTGITLPAALAGGYPALCFDATRPHIIFRNEVGSGTVAYDWTTGRRQLVNARLFIGCGPGGLLFAAGPGTWRFSLDDPAGQAIPYWPSAVAADGSLQVYAPGNPHTATDPKMWYSADGGLTWQPRLAGLNRNLNAIVAAGADARVVYLEVWGTFGEQRHSNLGDFTFLQSTDTGQTWQEQSTIRGSVTVAGPMAAIGRLPGRRAPVDTLALGMIDGSGPRFTETESVSRDGARTFGAVGYNHWTEYSYWASRVAHDGAGVVSLQYRSAEDCCNAPYTHTLHTTLELWPDAASSSVDLPLPFPATIVGDVPTGAVETLVVPDELPGNLFLGLGTALYHSADGGHTWGELPAFSGKELYASPYLALTVLDVHADGHLFALDVPGAGQKLRAPATPTGAPGSRFFAETGHTLAGPFLAYWQGHGGLVQLGYPLTDEVRTVSPVDSRVYDMQYFERAVLERHPENAPPYDILGSLSGAFAYTAGYGATGAAAQHASTTNARFFPQTGHALGGVFRSYWETHGGLTQQGYPVSDEFTEVSALDGRPYTVQYFQRAVFEWHPTNAGTPYEVLLSQLGRYQLDGDLPGLPVCSSAPAAPFTPLWAGNPAAAALLGCRAADPRDVATAGAPFEHGRLVWLAVSPFPDLSGPVILLLGDDGRYRYYQDSYVDGAPAACSPTPPTGRLLPQRGFNRLWCMVPEVRSQLGWALAPEVGSAGRVQAFAQGILLQTPSNSRIVALGNLPPGARQGPIWHAFVDPGP